MTCQAIASNGKRFTGGAGWKFQNRVGAKAEGNAPGLQAVMHFDDALVTTKIDHINGKAHSEGVDSFARRDEQSAAFGKSVASKQSLTSGAALACNFRRSG